MHQNLHKNGSQPCDDQASSLFSNSPMQLIDLMQMEDGLRRENLIINELQFDLEKIKDKFRQVRVGQKINFCYVYLRKIFGQVQENFNKNTFESLYSKPSNLNQIIIIENIEIITYLIDTIEEILMLSQSQQFNQDIYKSIYFDIVTIHLTTHISVIKARQSSKKIEYLYSRGEELIKTVEKLISPSDIFNLKKLIYDFRFFSLPQFNIKQREIFSNFVGYYFENNDKLEQLYTFEYNSKYLFLDNCFEYLSDPNSFNEIYQTILTLNDKFPDHFYLLEMKWKFYISYMRHSKEYISNELEIIQADLYNIKNWEYSFYQLSFYNSRRIIQIFKKIVVLKESQNYQICTMWLQMIIQKIIKADSQRWVEKKNFENHFALKIDLLNFILDKNIEMDIASEIKSLEQQFLDSGLSDQLSKKVLNLILKNYQKFNHVFDIIEIAKHIYFKWNSKGVIDDEWQTVELLIQCSNQYEKLRIINLVIFGQVIQGCLAKIKNNQASICKAFSVFQRYSELLMERNKQERNKQQQITPNFLIDQIRLIFRSCLCCYSVRERAISSPRDMNSSDFIYFYYPLLNLKTGILDSIEYVVQIQRQGFISVDPFSDLIKSIFQLFRQLSKYDHNDLYDIVICLLKLIYVNQKLVSQGKEECTQLNVQCSSVQNIAYQLLVQLMLETKDYKKNIMDAQLRLINESECFSDFKLTFLNVKQYTNWKFLEILISVIFECSQSKVPDNKLFLYELSRGLEKNKSLALVFSPILEKLILLFAIVEEVETQEFIVSIINAVSMVKFTVVQFNQLLRLCLANSQKSLIFNNLIPQFNLRPYQEQLMQHHDINIFDERQLTLIEKYNIESVSRNVFQILDKLADQIKKKEKKPCYLFFKDMNSLISFPTNLDVQQGFTLYFELSFARLKGEKISLFEKVSFSYVQMEVHFSEFATIYFDANQNQCGFKILVQPNKLKLLHFNLQKDGNTETQTQEFKIQNIQAKIYSYRLTFNSKEQFKCYINDKLCENRNETIKTNIAKFIKVELGHSVPIESSLSLKLSTIAFELQQTSFKGKLYQFLIFNQQTFNSEQWSIKLQMQQRDFSVQYNSGYIGLLDKEFQFEQKNVSENNQEIVELEHTVRGVSQINRSQLLEIFKMQKAPIMIMLIIQEIVNCQNVGKTILWYLRLLLNKVVFIDDTLLSQFFGDLQIFEEILQKIVEKCDNEQVFRILKDFLEQLSKKNQKLFHQFTNELILKFSIFESIKDNSFLQEKFFKDILSVCSPNLVNLINSIRDHKDLPLLSSRYFFDFLGNLLVKDYQVQINYSLKKGMNPQQIKNQEALVQIYLSQIQQINRLFSFQNFTDGYFQLFKKYFQLLFDIMPKIMNSQLSKYSSILILNRQKDYLFLTQFLNLIFADQSDFWRAVSMTFFLESHHQNSQFSELAKLLNEKIKIDQFNQFNYDLQIIETIFDDLEFSKLQYAFIDLLADLLPNQKEETINQRILRKITRQKLDRLTRQKNIKMESQIDPIFDQTDQDFQQMLFDILTMQKNSKIEQLIDTLAPLYHEQSQDFNCFIQYMLFNRFNDNYLNEEHLKRFLKLLQQSPRNFHNLFEKIIQTLQNNQKSLIHHVNLIYILIIMEYECFSETYNDDVLDKQFVQVLNDCLDYLRTKNFFSFPEEFTDKEWEKKQIRNINFLPYGGLFRLFTSMILTASERKNQECIISMAIKLLSIYLEYLQKPCNDPFVNKVYEHFKCRRSQSGYAFPIIMQIFQSKFIIRSEYLQNQQKILMGIYEKSKEYLNCVTMKENMNRYKEQKKWKSTEIYSKQQQNDSRSFKSLDDTASTSASLVRRITQSEINTQFEQRPIQPLKDYRSFYLYHNIQSDKKFKEIQAILENSLKDNLMEYEIKYYPTNNLDFENRIIFSESEPPPQEVEFALTFTSDSIQMMGKKSNTQVTLQSNNTSISVLQTVTQGTSVVVRHKDLQSIKEYNILFENKQILDNFLKECLKKEIFYCKNPFDDFKEIIQQKWIFSKLSNYQYIFLLNYYGGRNLLDKNNYYIFPWMAQNFTQAFLASDRNLLSTYYKIENPENFRYFSNSTQVEYFQKKKPIDLVDFFNEIQQFGEALPEIYTSVEFFKNFRFPSWVPTQTSEEFIYIMRQSLESQSAQERLNHWFDIIFGIYSNYQGSKKKDTTVCHYYEQFQEIQDMKNEDKQFAIEKFGQSPKQIFKNLHPRKQQICHLYENQKKWNFDTKNLLLETDGKIISIYHQPLCYIFAITENGKAYVIATDQPISSHLLTQKELKLIQKKNLKTLSKLNLNLVAFIDFENQQLPDNQESQSHFLEHNNQSFFTKPPIFIIVAGYKNEFQVFQGANLKQIQTCNTNDIVTCIRFCHYRQVLIVGQGDSNIGLWRVKKSGEILEQYCRINSHCSPIVTMDYTATKILSIDSINEAHVHYYDGQLITIILLDTFGRINYCSISDTMNLYIFLDSFNQLMAYTFTGEKYIEPMEYLQQITTLLPLTKFCSQFFFSTKSDLYFDDFFNIKMQQSGKVLDEAQQERVYNYNFRNFKSLKQGNLLPNQNSVITASAITSMNTHEMSFIFLGCEDGKLWCVYQEDQITTCMKKKLEQSGLTKN